MSNVQLPISLSKDSIRKSDDLLFLEQKKYSTYTGKLTKAGMALAVLGWLYPDEGYDIENACGGEDGVFTTEVYAYLYDQNLNYNIGLSYGLLGNRIIQDIDYVEIIRSSLQDYVEFSYPNEGLKSVEWIGNAYNTKGEIIGTPEYTSDNRGITFNERVYSSLKVRYRVRRHAYSIRIESRVKKDENVTENKYSSTAYAYWNGGVDWEIIQAPYGFEDFDGQCGNGTILKPVGPEDPDDPPTAPPRNKTDHLDYCTQKLK